MTGICFSGRDKDCEPAASATKQGVKEQFLSNPWSNLFGNKKRSVIRCTPVQETVDQPDDDFSTCHANPKHDYELYPCPLGEAMVGWCNGGALKDCNCVSIDFTGGSHVGGKCAKVTYASHAGI